MQAESCESSVSKKKEEKKKFEHLLKSLKSVFENVLFGSLPFKMNAHCGIFRADQSEIDGVLVGNLVAPALTPHNRNVISFFFSDIFWQVFTAQKK